MQLGVLGIALEDPVERNALVRFFVSVLLPLEVTTKKIAELIVKELERQLLIGAGDSFQTLSARNKVALDAVNAFLEKTFGSEWKEKEKEKEKDSGS